ncbi:MAG: CAP domain-containing protein [Myxococcales bacterium]|nr:CAP domain-containing protein [Myxococcales bacterium]
MDLGHRVLTALLVACMLPLLSCGDDLGGLFDPQQVLACDQADDPIPACEDNGGCAGGEQGRMAGMVEAHNRVRAALRDPEPSTPLPPLTWSDDLAAVAKDWALELVDRGCPLTHSRDCRYGENLAWFLGFEPTAAEVVEDGWASEEACYSYGTFMGSDSCTSACDDSGGCGHYTQIIWEGTREVGCAVEACDDGAEVWVCNYAPVGNIVGRPPY